MTVGAAAAGLAAAQDRASAAAVLRERFVQCFVDQFVSTGVLLTAYGADRPLVETA